MINATTELAIRWLVFLAVNNRGEPVSPKRGAESLACSPSYLAKTSNILVKAGILQSTRGIRGGVLLAKNPEDITLLEIVEATEGLMTAAFCHEAGKEEEVCSFHQAMKDLHESVTRLLSDWTLQRILERPARCPEIGESQCKMFFKDCSKLQNTEPE